MSTPVVERAAWLGFRWRRHGLDAPVPAADDLLLLGVQDARAGGAAEALARRGITDPIGAGSTLVAMWSVRGAPHVHRASQLDAVRDAWAPTEQDDGGPARVDDVARVAEALAAVVTGPTTKGDASAAVSARVPDLTVPCARCGSTHVPDGLFRDAGRQARLVLGPSENRATVLQPGSGRARRPPADPRGAVLQALFRTNGPLTPALFRDWSATGTPATRSLWARVRGLESVRLEGRRHDVPADLLDDVVGAQPARGVVLLPPGDPYLRQVDRTALVPAAARRREIWRPVSPPGALVVDGEVAGAWRHRRSDRTLTVTAFEPPSAGTRRAVAENAVALGDPALRWA